MFLLLGYYVHVHVHVHIMHMHVNNYCFFLLLLKAVVNRRTQRDCKLSLVTAWSDGCLDIIMPIVFPIM